MKYIKGFIIGVLTVFIGIFLMIRWAWKKVRMDEERTISKGIKDVIITFITKLFYGEEYCLVRRQYPRYVHYADEANEILRKLEKEYYGRD